VATAIKLAPDKSKLKTKPIHLVYAGVRRFTDGTYGGSFYTLPNPDEPLPPDPENSLFGWALVKNLGNPGSIFVYQAVEREDGSDGLSILSKSGRWCGRLDDPRVAGWQAEHDATLLLKSTQAREKKGKQTNILDRYIEPLQRAYRSLRTEPDRQAFLLQIICRIQGDL